MLKSRELLKSSVLYSNLVSRISSVCLKSNLCTESTKDIELKCWKCSKSLSSKNLFCEYCCSVQKPDAQTNFYDLFDLKMKFLIDKEELSKKFKHLQSQLHPDKFSTKEKDEQSISETYSSHLNRAYSTLQDPLERGLYLLSLENISIDEDSKGTDQTLLMEVLMLNEQLDDAEDEMELDKLQVDVRDTIDDLNKQTSESFEKKDFARAKELLTKMKFYATLDSKLREKRNRLELDRTSRT